MSEKVVKENQPENTGSAKQREPKVNMRDLSPLFRYGLLKARIRNINLEKGEAGYKAQYFYVALQDMQKVFVELEQEHLLTSIYSEETRYYGHGESSGAVFKNGIVFKNFAVRKLFDLVSGGLVVSTEIDITNLKQITDPFEIKQDILRISEPKDAWKTLYLDFFEPQNLGSVSTYFQRYTYNQLYDFQETKEDKIETKGKVQGSPKVEEKPEVAPKEKRLNDEAMEIRSKVKNDFIREDIIKQLNGRKLASMNKQEAESFYEEMVKNYSQKKNEID